jgi:hypothetical protein
MERQADVETALDLKPSEPAKGLSGSTPDLSARGWSVSALSIHAPQSSSLTDLLSRLGVPRTPNRLRAVAEDLQALGVDTEHFVSRKLYEEEALQAAVSGSTSFAGAARLLGSSLSGASLAHLKARVLQLGLDISHFSGQGWSRGVVLDNRRKPASDILVRQPAGSHRASTTLLRRALTEVGFPYLCAICGIGPEWNGVELTLEIDHVDGDALNNLQENLRFLCPNCHSQTPTYKNKRRKRAAR